ncbi:hypothetical protein V6Z77_009150 [Aspergillus fumigatus]
MSKILTVFGATGKQGGSVIRTILQDAKLSQEFRIRGITRDTTKPAAQALSKQGVELRNMLQNHLFIENPGYFNGRDLKESNDWLEKAGYQPTSWREFLERNKAAFLQ